MAHRFCTRCNAEVEDTGGYCLLGHDLRLEAPVDSLKALRAEVNRTFDEARAELADVMAPAAALAPELAELAHPAGVDVPNAHSVRLDEALVIEGADDEREWSDVPVSVAPRSEPVDGAKSVETHDPAMPAARPGVWDGLDEAPALNPGDPIATFAPSPRMDWGPRKAPFGKRRVADELPADA